MVSVKIDTQYQCFILQRATEWDANKIKTIINKPNSSFYDLVSAELPFGSVLLPLKPELIHHTAPAHPPRHGDLFQGCFALSPPTGALFKSATTSENPSLSSGGFGPAAELCTVQERLQREEGGGETKAGAQDGSADPSACRQHPTSTSKKQGTLLQPLGLYPQVPLATVTICRGLLAVVPLHSAGSGSGQGTSLEKLCSGLPGCELTAGPGWETLHSLTFIPYISPSSRGTSKINTGIKKAFWRQIDAFCFPSNA